MKNKVKEYGVIAIVLCVIIVGALFYYLQTPKEAQIEFDDFNTPEPIKEENNYMYIDIKGQVYNPGVYKVETNTRLYELIFKAGGLTDIADEAAINLSLILIDENVIYIPSFEDDFPALGIIKEEEIVTEKDKVININTASKEELMTLPGIGESTALTILTYRENNGFFETSEGIMDVPGIGEVTFENIKTLITV